MLISWQIWTGTIFEAVFGGPNGLDVGARAMAVNWDRIDKLIYADRIVPLVARVVRRRFALDRSRLAGKAPGHASSSP